VLRVRHQRVAALLRALGLPPIGELVTGRFLDGAAGREPVYEELVGRAADPRPRRFVPPHLLFSGLLHYRLDVERVIRATSGVLECGDSMLAGLFVTQVAIGRQLSEAVADVDRWLCGLLDPDARSFTERALIAEHGWPDVDLRRLMIDEA
jgi:hypothetical protein